MDCFATLAMTKGGAEFRVKSSNVVSLRDKFYYLGPAVKPRDDKGGGYNVSRGYCVPCAYPRICSNCAVACFHILGFIAREHRDRGDPVNNMCRIRDGINNLGPVVCIHPRKLTFSRGPGRGMTHLNFF